MKVGFGQIIVFSGYTKLYKESNLSNKWYIFYEFAYEQLYNRVVAVLFYFTPSIMLICTTHCLFILFCEKKMSHGMKTQITSPYLMMLA